MKFPCTKAFFTQLQTRLHQFRWLLRRRISWISIEKRRLESLGLQDMKLGGRKRNSSESSRSRKRHDKAVNFHPQYRLSPGKKRGVSAAGDGQERGKARRKAGDIYYDFNWTLCLFNDCCSRLPSPVGPSKFRNTGADFVYSLQQPLPSAKFPARRATVQPPSLQPLSREPPSPRENLSLYTPWTAISLPSIRLILASRVLLNIIS